MTNIKAGASQSVDRNDIIARLRRSEITREQAEEWAVQNEQLPFVSKPVAACFDPMKQTDWTLAMAAAWIIWRTEDAVREHWDDYRLQCYEWRVCEETFADGAKGWEALKRKGASVHDVWRQAACAEHNAPKPKAGMHIDDLWNALMAGTIEATGIPHSRRDLANLSPTRVVIPRHEWVDLSKVDYHNGLPDSVATALDNEARYSAVRAWRDDILRLWEHTGSKSSIAAATQCRKWLIEQIQASPRLRPKPKSEYRKAALARFPGLSENQFDAQWASAIEDQHAEAWRKAGRPRKQLNHGTK